eukprot:CAMPEP_0116912404 /NCGR_PEP_ID=MMETSP0467-20121206/16064_1 /TAXON_ID=283647 /ORGANISM="Mesodinium pulex, Strain SPMC105" /LENGTH=69 /DNA_ID=CAMNT_0004588373 /DNA_START=153 /DNA_END=362 /DNA_ORIENTATION=-
MNRAKKCTKVYDIREEPLYEATDEFDLEAMKADFKNKLTPAMPSATPNLMNLTAKKRPAKQEGVQFVND